MKKRKEKKIHYEVDFTYWLLRKKINQRQGRATPLTQIPAGMASQNNPLEVGGRAAVPN